MTSVGKAAGDMEEIRRQFREIPAFEAKRVCQILRRVLIFRPKLHLEKWWHQGRCGSSTHSSRFCARLLGLGGLLAGSPLTGVLMALFMANAGGAWTMQRRHRTRPHRGEKKGTAHSAAVIGDTIGDPFWDTKFFPKHPDQVDVDCSSNRSKPRCDWLHELDLIMGTKPFREGACELHARRSLCGSPHSYPSHCKGAGGTGGILVVETK